MILDTKISPSQLTLFICHLEENEVKALDSKECRNPFHLCIFREVGGIVLVSETLTFKTCLFNLHT